MSVDKFGRYYSPKKNYDNILKRKNATKVFDIIMDSDNNFNVQNKRIKNIANPLEEKDAVSKAFLLTKIDQSKAEVLISSRKYHSYVDGELASLHIKVADLKTLILDLVGKENVVEEPTIKYLNGDEKFDDSNILKYTIDNDDEYKENSSTRIA